MTKRFTYEMIIGILGVAAVLWFGEKGMAVLALLAAQPFIGKKKADERESQLFNKVGNITAAATLLACVIIHFSSDFVVNGFKIGESWLILAVFSFVLAHGTAGLIIFKRG